MKLGTKSIIILVNLVILLLYSAAMIYELKTNSSTDGVHYGLGYLLGMCFAIGAHVCLNIFISIGAFIQKSKKVGQAFLLSAVLVLLIGFSACMGGANM